MRIETLSVREAREQLPGVLDRFRSGDRQPMFLGSHRRTEAVVLPVAVYDELMAHRQQTADQVTASLRAEGLSATPSTQALIEQWVHGDVDAMELERQVKALYGIA